MNLQFVRPTKNVLNLLIVCFSCGFIMPSFASVKSKQIAEAKQIITNKKIDFLINIARNASIQKTNKSTVYKLAIYGKGEAAKLLYNQLEKKSLRVGGKSVEVKWFKRIGAVKDVDLIYVNGASKLSLFELSERVSDECLIVTEDFPYGQSAINFSVSNSNDISYELQEDILTNKGVVLSGNLASASSRIRNENAWKNMLLNAESTIQKQEATIKNQKGTISKKDEKLKENFSKINDQELNIQENEQKIEENQRVIDQQRTLITVITIASILTAFLLFLLFRMHKKRKVTLHKLEEKTGEVLASITYAERIQRASLPSTELLNSTLKEGFLIYEPKDIVSGDFYWLEETEEVTYFAVADCTGHGVPGAMLSVLCSNTLSRAVNELGILTPAKILDASVTLLEEFFSKSGNSLNDGMDIVLCSISKKEHRLQYAGANRPLMYVKDGELKVQKADRQPIGKYEHRKPYENHVIDLSKGDTVYLFSDGIVDQFGGDNNKKFSTKRLRKILSEIQGNTMEEQAQKLKEVLAEWKGEEEAIDDACMLAIRIL